MNEPDFLKLIAEGENLHREFEETLPDNESLAKSLVSFANTDGGRLILGVSDCGKITGIDAPDRAINRINDIAYNRCNPPVTVVQETLTVNSKQIILVNIPRGSLRPCEKSRCKKDSCNCRNCLLIILMRPYRLPA